MNGASAQSDDDALPIPPQVAAEAQARADAISSQATLEDGTVISIYAPKLPNPVPPYVGPPIDFSSWPPTVEGEEDVDG